MSTLNHRGWIRKHIGFVASLVVALGCAAAGHAQITTFPYSESFESNSAGWSATGVIHDLDNHETTQPLHSWMWGIPNDSFISSAGDGTRAWVTNLTSDYFPREKSFLTSPVFDFSGFSADPVLGFMRIHRFAFNGLVTVEISIDSAVTWNVLGGIGTGVNWYTASYLGSFDAWSGSAGWASARHILTGTAGESDVRIRFKFNTSTSVDEGFAMDLVTIAQSPKDIGVISIDSPTTGIGARTAETVTITIQNFDLTPQSNFPVFYTIDDGDPVQETFTGTLNFNQTAEFIFTATADLSAFGSHEIVASTNLSGETNTANDSQTITVYTLDPTADVGVLSLDSPRSGNDLGATETVTITIKNFGSSEQSNFDVTLVTTRYPGVNVAETFAGPISAGATAQHTFATTIDLSAFTLHTVIVGTSLSVDSNVDNDVLVVRVLRPRPLEDFPYSDDFTHPEHGWLVSGANSSWEGGTPGGTFISAGGADGGAWVTNLDGNYNNDELSYLSPPRFDFTSLAEDPVFQFSHIFTTESGTDLGWVDFSVDGGNSWTKLGDARKSGVNWYNDVANQAWSGDSGAADEWKFAEHVLPGTAGMADVRLRFAMSSNSTTAQEGFGIDDVFVRIGRLDLGAVGIVSPVSAQNLSATETVTMEVENLGTLIHSNFDVSYSVNGGAVTTETFTESLAPGQRRMHTFAVTADLSLPGDYVFELGANASGDVDTTNDVINRVVVHQEPISQFPYFEDFEESSGGWFGGGTESSWVRGLPNGGTISSAGSGSYAWVTNLVGPVNIDEASYLESAIFDMSTLASDPVIQFMLIYQTLIGYYDSIWLEMSIDGGAEWTKVGASGEGSNWYNHDDVWTGTSTPEGDWLVANHELTGVAGQADVRLRFRIEINGYSDRFEEGLGIDAIAIGDPVRDVGVASIDEPVDGSVVAGAQQITVTIENFGTDEQSNFDVSYAVNGLPPVTEVFAGPLASGATTSHSFAATVDMSQPGDYLIETSTSLSGDFFSPNDGASAIINKTAPPGPALTLPYFEDFEAGDGGWSAGGTNNSWELGVPRGGFISHAGSGANAWVTNLNGPYTDDEESYVESPKFDFTSVASDPTLSFLHIFYTESCCDDGWLEISTNDGDTWSKLGTAGSGVNWYNDETELWWEGKSDDVETDGTWRLASHTMTGTAGEASVRLRFRLSTDGSVTEEGFGVDRIQILEDAANDVGIISIDAPLPSSVFTNSETVTVTIANFGTASQSNFGVSFSDDGAKAATETFTGTVEPGATAPFTFAATADLSTGDEHSITAMTELVGDAIPENDAFTSVLTGVAATRSVPYFEDFESGPGGWVSGGDNNSWAFGTPQKDLIVGAASGLNAWVTGGLGTGVYESNEASYVMGPVFDFSMVSEPTFSMRIWWDSERGYDGATLQSTVDAGDTWQVVGAPFDPVNWYNEDDLSTPFGVTEGWSGETTYDPHGWVRASHALDGLAGEPSVQFRVIFGSDDGEESDGFAFDDVTIVDGSGPGVTPRGVAEPEGVIPSGTSDLLVAAIDILGNQSVEEITSAAFSRVGTLENSGITNATLWLDINGDKEFSALFDLPIATVDVPSGTFTFDSLSRVLLLVPNETIHLFITFSLANVLTDNATFGVVLDSPANVTFDSGIAGVSSTTFPYAFPLFTAGIVDLVATKDDSISSDMDDDGVADPGDTLLYTVTLDNNGSLDALGVVFSDTPDANTSLAVGTVQTSEGDILSGNGKGETTVQVDIGTISDQTVTISFEVIIDDPLSAGEVSNQGGVTGDNFEGFATDDPGTGATNDPTVTAVPQADLSITVDNGRTSSQPGDEVTYTIVIENTGPSDVSGARVTDTFPASLTGVTWTRVASRGASGVGDIDDLIDVPSGSIVTYTAVGIFQAMHSGALSNSARVTAPTAVHDPDETNNFAFDTDDFLALVDLSITKDDGMDTVEGGDTITYTITVANDGGSDVLFGLSNGGNPESDSYLYTIDMDTGFAGLVGSTGYKACSGLALSPDGVLYATCGATSESQVLLNIDPFTGIATEIGLTENTTETISDLSFGPDGTLYGFGESGNIAANSTLYALDLGTGEATPLTVTNPLDEPQVGNGLAFDSAGSLFQAGEIALLVIDPGSGVALIQALLGFSAPADNAPRINAMDVNPGTGEMFVSIDDSNGALEHHLGVLDTKSGLVTVIGPTVDGLDAIAFMPGFTLENILVADTMPESLMKVTWTSEGTAGTESTSSGSGNILDFVTIPSGGSITYMATGTLDINALGNLSNTATVTAPIRTLDTNLENNSATDTDSLLGAPEVTPIDDVVVDEDAPDTVIDLFAAFEDAQDPDEDLVFTVSDNTNEALVSGTSINAAAGTLTLGYAANANGDAEITVRALDTSGLFTEDTFSVSVTPVNDAPVLDPIGPRSVTEGDVLQFTVTGSDIENDSLSFSANNLPAGATFESRIFTWATIAGDAGTFDDVTFTVTDDGAPNESSSEAITITVNDDGGEGGGEGEGEGADELCAAFLDIISQLEAFQAAFGLDPDVDSDGLPEAASLALAEYAVCMSDDNELIDATVNAYLINLEIFTVEPARGAFDEATTVAALMLISASVQDELKIELTLTGDYVSVVCDDVTGECTPDSIKGVALSDAFEAFEAGSKSLFEPYSGSGDFDDDGETNAAEWEEVMGNDEPLIDFIDANTAAAGCGAGPFAPQGETSGTVTLLALAALLLAFRRRAHGAKSGK